MLRTLVLSDVVSKHKNSNIWKHFIIGGLSSGLLKICLLIYLTTGKLSKVLIKVSEYAVN